jgi:hypothetical protein
MGLFTFVMGLTTDDKGQRLIAPARKFIRETVKRDWRDVSNVMKRGDRECNDVLALYR